MKNVSSILVSLLFFTLCPFALVAQTSEQEILQQLRAIHDNPDATVEDLQSAATLMQKLVDEYPASDAAVSILLSDDFEGIDFGSFSGRLEALQTEVLNQDDPRTSSKLACISEALSSALQSDIHLVISLDESGDISGLPQLVKPENPDSIARLEYLNLVSALEQCAPFERPELDDQLELRVVAGEISFGSKGSSDAEVAEPLLTAAVPQILSTGTRASEELLALSKRDIRDVQARLLVIGKDPNGVDGVAGNGTRAAVRAWQDTVGAEPTGYLNSEQLAVLKEQSQARLDEWLRSDGNAKLYNPPPALAIGPRNMSGSWRYTTNCGSRSRLGKIKITGALVMQHAGGRNYTGTLSNSQGFRGRVSATLRGRSVSAVTNFGLLLGKVSLKARVDDHKLVLRGRDSNGCSFYARKS